MTLPALQKQKSIKVQVAASLLLTILVSAVEPRPQATVERETDQPPPLSRAAIPDDFEVVDGTALNY